MCSSAASIDIIFTRSHGQMAGYYRIPPAEPNDAIPDTSDALPSASGPISQVVYPQIFQSRGLKTPRPVRAVLRPLPPIPADDRPISSTTIEDTIDMAANNSSAFPPLDNSMNTPNRSPGPASQVNGNGASYSNNYAPPLPVGHQQDLHFLYQQIQELSGLLQSNRQAVNDVTKSAEEVARRSHLTNGHSQEETSPDIALTQAQTKIRDLEHDLAKTNRIISLYKHEQSENTSLIGKYEQGMWEATDQVREYTAKTEDRFLAQKRQYNDLLQQEKDEHGQTRLDRDHWMGVAMKVCDMVRKAHRLRTDEWCDEYRIVVALQSEVRCYRRILGMEPEKPEDEAGWPYLKDAPFNDQA